LHLWGEPGVGNDFMLVLTGCSTLSEDFGKIFIDSDVKAKAAQGFF